MDRRKVNRQQPPPIHTIDRLQLPAIGVHRLSNGMPVYEVRLGTQEVVRLDVIFHAGRPYEEKRLAARATAAQIKEGTRRLDSAAIDEHFDFYGSSLSTSANLDTGNLVLHSLTRHFDQVLPVLAEVLAEPTFPEDELTTFIQRNVRRLQVDLSKPDVVAFRQITESIFGADHPYGYNSLAGTYQALQRGDLQTHYERLYTSGNGLIVISGKTNDHILQVLDQHLGQAIPDGLPVTVSPEVHTAAPGKVHIRHPDRVQTALRIGRLLFRRDHPDHHGFYVLNTILGGYFGSRLMANIREEKGYTYNIYSLLDTMRFDGCFYIATETGNEFVEDTLKQIYHEMAVLQEDLIDEEELEMVRNYLLGNFLTMLDGPFNVAEVLRTLLIEDLAPGYFGDLIQTVQTITPETLRDLAQRYLNPADMWEVVVGAET